jgi:putative flippase GtrA
MTRKSLGLLARHQTGALTASAVDFLMMICWVELRLGSSVSGTAVGAASGAITNFLLGRRWIFQAGNRSAARQAFRYALVSAGSLGLNSLGQYLALRVIGLPYVLCRVIVAAIVSVCWNFPLHRRFVFTGGMRDQGAAAVPEAGPGAGS